MRTSTQVKLKVKFQLGTLLYFYLKHVAIEVTSNENYPVYFQNTGCLKRINRFEKSYLFTYESHLNKQYTVTKETFSSFIGGFQSQTV